MRFPLIQLIVLLAVWGWLLATLRQSDFDVAAGCFAGLLLAPSWLILGSAFFRSIEPSRKTWVCLSFLASLAITAGPIAVFRMGMDPSLVLMTVFFAWPPQTVLLIGLHSVEEQRREREFFRRETRGGGNRKHDPPAAPRE